MQWQTNGENYRHECEVRFIAQMPLQERRKYLVLVMEKRGLAERKRLEGSLFVLWERKNGR